MHCDFAGALTSGCLLSAGQFGEVGLSADGRVYTGTRELHESQCCVLCGIVCRCHASSSRRCSPAPHAAWLAPAAAGAIIVQPTCEVHQGKVSWFFSTEVAQPGPEQQAYTDSRRTILLDDGLAVSDPKPARYPAPGALLSAPDAASHSMVLLPA
jgi:hypothetical protein